VRWALTDLANSSPFQIRNSSIDPDSPADPDSKARPRLFVGVKVAVE
jgi:hypothetical protein